MRYLTIPAGGAVAQMVKGRGLLTTLSAWTSVDASGTPAGVLADPLRLLDQVELRYDKAGVPDEVVASAPLWQGFTDPLELIARFSTEVYLDPDRKQWLVWRASSGGDLAVAVGQTPAPDDVTRTAQAESNALAYLDPVKRLVGSSWVAVDSSDAASVAFKLGVHPWQVLAKECRRIACKLQYLYYEKELQTPSGSYGWATGYFSGPKEQWWLENMANIHGEQWHECEVCPSYPPTQYQSPFNPPRFACAEAEGASEITNTIYPITQTADPLSGNLSPIDPTIFLLPIFGAKEWHVAAYQGPDGVNGPLNFYAYAQAGMSSFNVSDVKNRRAFGRQPVLVPRLGVVEATIVSGGAGHVVNERLSVRNGTADAPAVVKVTSVSPTGEIIAISVESAGRFVIPEMSLVSGDVELALVYGIVQVAVLNGGEGFTSADVEVYHDDLGPEVTPAVLNVTVVESTEGGFTIATVIPSPQGRGYGQMPQLLMRGTGLPDASCLTSWCCQNDGNGSGSTVLGSRVGLPAKAYLKVRALARVLVTPTPPLDLPYQTYDETHEIATGDPLMKSTPPPPVKVSVPPSYQPFGSYNTAGRFVSGSVGAAHPHYDFHCPAAFGTTGSEWQATYLSVVVNRAGHWRYDT